MKDQRLTEETQIAQWDKEKRLNVYSFNLFFSEHGRNRYNRYFRIVYSSDHRKAEGGSTQEEGVYMYLHLKSDIQQPADDFGVT